MHFRQVGLFLPVLGRGVGRGWWDFYLCLRCSWLENYTRLFVCHHGAVQYSYHAVSRCTSFLTFHGCVFVSQMDIERSALPALPQAQRPKSFSEATRITQLISTEHLYSSWHMYARSSCTSTSNPYARCMHAQSLFPQTATLPSRNPNNLPASTLSKPAVPSLRLEHCSTGEKAIL